MSCWPLSAFGMYMPLPKTHKQPNKTICRDDRCTDISIHPAHSLSFGIDLFCDPNYDSNEDDPTLVHKHHGAALTKSILCQISSTQCRTIRQIYNGVVDDYGEVNQRTVNRRISSLVKQGVLTRVFLPENNMFCGYVNSTSRLIKDGVPSEAILESLRAQVPTGSGTK